jgi:DNA invertase Pin-like site-specific DNA recombinase
MNVVLYLRYSSEKQNEQSIEGQQRICMQYCEQNNLNVIDCYIDRALSASKNIEKRESFQRMIKDSEKRAFEGIVVYKLDRFARNRYDSATYKNKLRKNGVRVISATENITDNPEGIILESVLEGMAEFYSAELAQKITRGMNETALKCNSCGGSIPLGYKIQNKKFVIDPQTAPIVVEAFERYAQGETISEIATSFNNRGFRTAKGVLFNKNSFRSMFRNERYIGIYKYKDIRIEGGLPAIVDKETFKKVQDMLQINVKAPAQKRATQNYLLSQKLFCGHCGTLMTGECGTSKNGERHYYYKCATAKHEHACDKKAIRKEWIERIVVMDALELLSPERIDELADMAIRQIELDIEENTSIPALQKRIKETENGIENLLKLVERGSTSETLFNRLEELEEQKKVLQRTLDQEKMQVVVLEKPHIVWWLTQFSKGDVNDENFRRQVIDMLVNSVTVWDEPDGWYKITTVYNLTSEKTRTFRCSTENSNAPPAGSVCTQSSTKYSAKPNFIPRW